MGLAKRKREYTVADIYALPEGTRAELINGEIIMQAAPSRAHQRMALKLSAQIDAYISANKGKCEVNIAPFAVFLYNDDSTYVEPDISVVCDRSKLDKHGCNGAPDWVIEIVSPSTRRMDYMVKLFQYQAAGVREYWIVDPEESLVTVYNFERMDIQKYKFSDTVPAGIYEDFAIDFSAIDLS